MQERAVLVFKFVLLPAGFSACLSPTLSVNDSPIQSNKPASFTGGSDLLRVVTQHPSARTLRCQTQRVSR